MLLLIIVTNGNVNREVFQGPRSTVREDYGFQLPSTDHSGSVEEQGATELLQVAIHPSSAIVRPKFLQYPSCLYLQRQWLEKPHTLSLLAEPSAEHQEITSLMQGNIQSHQSQWRRAYNPRRDIEQFAGSKLFWAHCIQACVEQELLELVEGLPTVDIVQGDRTDFFSLYLEFLEYYYPEVDCVESVQEFALNWNNFVSATLVAFLRDVPLQAFINAPESFSIDDSHVLSCQVLQYRHNAGFHQKYQEPAPDIDGDYAGAHQKRQQQVGYKYHTYWTLALQYFCGDKLRCALWSLFSGKQVDSKRMYDLKYVEELPQTYHFKDFISSPFSLLTF